MNILLKRAAGAALALAGLVGGATAQAAWLGLDDGSYTVTLTGCASYAHCTNDTGTITVAGSGLSFMSFVQEGVLFEGNPNDYVQDGIWERSDIVNFSATTPLSFFSLVGPSATYASNTWIYCRNEGTQNACRPDTIGSWTATKVPEPGSLALLGLAAVALAGTRGSRRRAATTAR